jgi:3'-5' exoribonuclease
VKDFYVKDASTRENQQITSFFLVASKQVRSKKNGDPYLALTLSDRTGLIEAKMWDNVLAVAQLFRQDDFVKVRGRINSFNGRYEIILQQLRRAEESEIDLSDFVPKTSWDIEEMWYQLEQFVAKVQNQHLRELLEAFLTDQEISKLLHIAPAAQSLHHACLGGLLEHVVSLCTLCELVTVRYFWVDRDLLMAGAVLHDIGKIYELTYNRAFQYSIEGLLVGHISIGLAMLQQKARAIPDFPGQLLVLLEHLILSHHGHLEYGSPIEPQFPEAVLLHYVDNIDSKMEAIRAALEMDPSPNEPWSDRIQSLGRRLLDTRKFLNSAQSAN